MGTPPIREIAELTQPVLYINHYSEVSSLFSSHMWLLMLELAQISCLAQYYSVINESKNSGNVDHRFKKIKNLNAQEEL